jgi:ATP-dependent 26S proteasome regulatory subunit
MPQETISEIEVLIRARYPIIYVLSWEEARVHNFIAKIAQKRNKKVFQWSYTTGIVPLGTMLQLRKNTSVSTQDPLAALNEVMEQVEPAIYVFNDFHPFLAKNNFAIIRRLKEIAQHLKDSYKSIIVVSPILSIPPELEKEITVVDFPLPNLQDMTFLLAKIISDVADNPNIHIELQGESKEHLLQAALGLTWNEAENVLAKIMVANNGRLREEDVNMVFSEKKQIIRKSGLLEYFETQDDLGRVGGLEELKEWLKKRRMAFSDKARQFGLPSPRGLLLLGVQGCGKSLCAKAVSSLWRMPLLRLDVGKMFGALVGSSEESIRRAIVTAESIAPCILWIDEIDKAFAGISGAASTDSGTSARVFGTFLTWMSEKQQPVFVIATANDVTHLPPELLRKGRFDEIFYIDLPGVAERTDIFKIHLLKRSRKPQQFDVQSLARACEGFSGAEIEEAIISSLYDAFYRQAELTTQDIRASLASTVPLSKTMAEHIGYLRNWVQGRARNASSVVPEESEGKRKMEISDFIDPPAKK